MSFCQKCVKHLLINFRRVVIYLYFVRTGYVGDFFSLFILHKLLNVDYSNWRSQPVIINTKTAISLLFCDGLRVHSQGQLSALLNTKTIHLSPDVVNIFTLNFRICTGQPLQSFLGRCISGKQKRNDSKFEQNVEFFSYCQKLWLLALCSEWKVLKDWIQKR